MKENEVKKMFNKINLAILLFLSALGSAYSATQITLPIPCSLPSCRQYDSTVVVDGVTGLPYSSSNPLPVTGGGGGGGGTQYTEGATTTPAIGAVTLCRYLSGGNTLTNTQLWGLACDSANNLLVKATQTGAWTITNAPAATGVAANSPSQCESVAYEASHACKASAGTIYRIVVYNSKTSAQFIQLFNSTTVPADTTAPITAPMNCPASSNCTYDFGTFGYALSTGISVSNSSTGPTKTIGSSDVWFSVAYK